MSDHADIVRESFLHVYEPSVHMPRATDKHAVDCPGCKGIAALDALVAERDAVQRARLESRVAVLEKAITEYLSDTTAGGDPIGPQWYIDCNERTKGTNYPGKARLARAVLAPSATGGSDE